MSQPAFTPAERELIARGVDSVISSLERAGLTIESDRERTLLALDAASSSLGSLVSQLKQSHPATTQEEA